MFSTGSIVVGHIDNQTLVNILCTFTPCLSLPPIQHDFNVGLSVCFLNLHCVMKVCEQRAIMARR